MQCENIFFGNLNELLNPTSRGVGDYLVGYEVEAIASQGQASVLVMLPNF